MPADAFNCPACGHDDYETVEVTKYDGTKYRTEFVCCARCRAMLWRPDIAGKPRVPDLSRGWSASGKTQV